MHVVGYTLSRAPQLLINDLEVLKVNPEDMFHKYEEDGFFSLLAKVTDGQDP